jgi:glycosyltransferase involved in cell wall biosynthesis
VPGALPAKAELAEKGRGVHLAKNQEQKEIRHMKQIRILHILPGLNYCGGIESFVMNYYRHIDRDKLYFDFIYNLDSPQPNYLGEIAKLGGKAFRFPQLGARGVLQCRVLFDKFLSEQPRYDIIHCSTANAAFIYLKIAEKHGIPVRILHSHQDRAADIFSHAVRNIPLLALGKRYATHNVACSAKAGDFLFGKADYTILNNAGDPEKYAYNPDMRGRIRRAFGIEEGTFLVGAVGRLCEQKNVIFAVEIFAELLKIHPNSRYMIVGDGILRDKLNERMTKLGVTDKVIFTGSRSDVPDLYQAMDTLLLPSLYEGLPFAAVESQHAGLPVLASDGCSKEVSFTDSIQFFPLSAGATAWARELVGYAAKPRSAAQINDQRFDIRVQAKRLEELYFKLISR